jgi:hypothetical protein
MSIIGERIIEAFFGGNSVFTHSNKFSDSKLNLMVSIRHSASEAVIEQWKKSFLQASKILFHATNGQLQFGTIQYANNSLGSSDADAFLYECSGKSSTGSKMYLCGDERFRPYTIVHELGHYAFELGDEYKTQSDDVAFCSNDPNTQRCIMEHKAEFGDSIDAGTGLLTLGTVNEFCDESNHDVTSDNIQQSRNKRSCWNTIVSTAPFCALKIPESERVFSDLGHAAMVWQELPPDQKFLFVLDLTSTSFASVSGTVAALKIWANYCRLTHAWMGLINSLGEVLFDIQPVDTDQKRDQIIAELLEFKLPNERRTPMVEAAKAFSKLKRSANQSMIWITESEHTADSLNQFATTLRQLAVHAYPLANASQFEELQLFASATGGAATCVKPREDPPDPAFTLQTALLLLSSDLIENAGSLGHEDIAWPSLGETSKQGNHSRSTSKEEELRIPIGELPFNIGRDYPFHVEAGCDRVSFMLACEHQSPVELALISPNGEVISGLTDQDGESNTVFRSIPNPSPGVWTARVLRTSPAQLSATLIATAENKQLYATLDCVVVGGSLTIGLKGSVFFGGPIADLTPVVEVYLDKPGRRAKPSFTCLHPVSRVVPDTRVTAERASGLYLGQITVEEPGVYTAVAKFRNLGTALRLAPCVCTKSLLTNLTPPFERVVRRQVIVK